MISGNLKTFPIPFTTSNFQVLGLSMKGVGGSGTWINGYSQTGFYLYIQNYNGNYSNVEVSWYACGF